MFTEASVQAMIDTALSLVSTTPLVSILAKYGAFRRKGDYYDIFFVETTNIILEK